MTTERIGKKGKIMLKTIRKWVVPFCAALTVAVAGFCLPTPWAAAADASAREKQLTGARLYSAEARTGKDLNTGVSLDSAPNTFEAWINLPQTAEPNGESRYGIVFGNYYSEKMRTQSVGMEIHTGGNPDIFWGGSHYKFTKIDVRTGLWTHLAIVRDKAANKLICYVNGAPMQTLNLTATQMPDLNLSKGTFYVGRDGRNNHEVAFFRGKLHSVTALSSVRTAEEIAADMERIPAFTDPGVLYSVKTDVENFPYKSYGYSYVAPALTSAPLAFETWIKLPGDAPDYVRGGSIFSNFTTDIYNDDGTYSFEIATHGMFTLFWNNMQFRYVFKGADLRTGDWVHVALVRDPEEKVFRYYVNGELNETVTAEADSPVNRREFSVGSDYRSWGIDNVPFLGEIRRITLYDRPIDADEIAADMNNADVRGSGVLANWNFSGAFTQSSPAVVADESGCGRNLRQGSYGNEYGEIEPVSGYDYALTVLPDTQVMTEYQPQRYSAMMSAIAGSVKTEKVKFLMHMGDIVNSDRNQERQYQNARDYMCSIENKIPYSFVPGNHDYTGQLVKNRDLSNFNKYFPYEEFSGMRGFGGAFEEGAMENAYYLFEAENVKYLVFALEFGPRDAVLEWANRVTRDNPDRRVIVTTHDYLNPTGSRDAADTEYSPYTYGFSRTSGMNVNCGEEIWQKFVKHHANIFLVLSGHQPHDDIVVSTDIGVNGNKVTQMLVNTQSLFIGGHPEGLAFMMKMNETTKEMQCYLYKPETGKLFNKTNQFTLSFADEKNPTVGAAANPDGTEDEGKKGCGASAAVSAAVLPAFLLSAGLVLLKKHRKV